MRNKMMLVRVETVEGNWNNSTEEVGLGISRGLF